MGNGKHGRCRRTPRAEENDCDVGTYRQVRPMFPKRTDAYGRNGGFHTGRYPKNAEEGIAGVFGRLYFYFAAGAVRATDAPNRYVPTSRIAENAGGRSTEYRDGIRQTPRTGDNDCDVGTYRQVRPTFPKRTDAKTMNGGFHIERCPPKNAKEGKDVRIRAVVSLNG